MTLHDVRFVLATFSPEIAQIGHLAAETPVEDRRVGVQLAGAARYADSTKMTTFPAVAVLPIPPDDL